jgi:hypothetical protein
MVKKQIYIDPIFIKGNVMRAYIWWDWSTRIEVKVEFLNKKIVVADRFKQIGFITELLRRNNIDFVLDKNSFINIHFGEIEGLDIKIMNIIF